MFSILSLFDWYQSPGPRAPPSGPPYVVACFIASYALMPHPQKQRYIRTTRKARLLNLK